MTDIALVMTLKLLFVFIGGFLLGFAAGYQYACADWGDE